MIKKIIIFFFSFILLFSFLFLSSCGTSYSSQEADPYRSGTEGVTLTFYGDSFIFYNNQYMNLELLLQNKGAYDEPQGKLVLSGYDPTILKISSEPLDLPEDLSGKNRFTPEGSLSFVSVPEDAPVSLSLSESYETTLQASVCYSYQTIATPTACLLYKPEDNYICEQETISLSSQGGPVAVLELDQAFVQDGVRFTTIIQHVGDGTVVNAYDVDAYDACPYALKKEDTNHIGVKMEISGLGEPDCIPSNSYIALNDDGIGVIICTFTLREEHSYTTPLKITLDYMYLSTVQQEVAAAVSSTAAGDSGLGTFFGDGSSGTDTDGSGSFDSDTGDCYCSEANMKKWGGCVCLSYNGVMYYCSEGETEIPVSAEAGDTITYEVHGSATVNKCGDSVHPSTACPFTAATSVPKKLALYGSVTDGRTVSERCNLVVS